MNAQSFLNSNQKREVEEAVAEAEKATAAEIVCAISTESGRYDRAESICGLIAALVVLGGVNFIDFSREGGALGNFGSPSGIGFGWQAVAVTLGFIAGSVIASYVHLLRRLFVGEKEMIAEVTRAASHVFGSRRLACTELRGGILVYLSLFERRVVVLADHALAEKVGQDFLDSLRDLAVEQLRAGRRAETFTQTIAEAKGKLAEMLPIQPDDKNELPNELVIIHPRP
ncbi:hypothetical protein KQI84_12035 [bacterium]|nr:hypothetical protein [bacterium]